MNARYGVSVDREVDDSVAAVDAVVDGNVDIKHDTALANPVRIRKSGPRPEVSFSIRRIVRVKAFAQPVLDFANARVPSRLVCVLAEDDAGVRIGARSTPQRVKVRHVRYFGHAYKDSFDRRRARKQSSSSVALRTPSLSASPRQAHSFCTSRHMGVISTAPAYDTAGASSERMAHSNMAKFDEKWSL